MSLRVIVSIGRPIRDAAELPEAFVAVRQSLTHRAVEPTSQIIDTDDVLPKGDYSAPYPFDVEREILNAMQMGWSDDAREGLRRFFNEVAMTGDRAFLVVESARQLLGNVLNTVLKSGFSPLVVFEGRDLYDELAELREVVHFERWFAERVVGPYITAIRSVQDLQSRRLVQQALELIHREYASPLFSLEWVADEVSSYPQKISTAFKEITGTNFVAYLTKHRLARAEELLKTTELPVSTVAERVGYQPSYFNRIFKKHQGVTPGEFRDDHARGEKARPAGR
jgi:YesN/AraC family two-component response regulator